MLSAPEKLSTTNLSLVPSVIVNKLVPKVFAPLTITSPVPFVSMVKSPFELVVEIIFSSKVILSTFH